MVNETTGATVVRLTPMVSISRPELNQETGKSSATEGRKLPVESSAKPQVLSHTEQVQEPQELHKAVREINEFVQNVQRDLSFNVDETSGRTVIKVIDRDSGDTVRQIPTEEVLVIARHIRSVSDESMSREVVPTGLLFSENT